MWQPHRLESRASEDTPDTPRSLLWNAGSCLPSSS